MNLHKILFPGKSKLIEEMDQKIMLSLEEIKVLQNESENILGKTLYNCPFTPEDIGFQIHTIPSQQVGEEDIFSRGDWTLARSYDDYHTYHVIGPKFKHDIYMPNLRDAIIALKAIGVLKQDENPIVKEI